MLDGWIPRLEDTHQRSRAGQYGLASAVALPLLTLLLTPGLPAQTHDERGPLRWTATLQSGMAETFQLTLGGTFGQGPMWQNRVEAGAVNVLAKGDTAYLFGVDATDTRGGANQWQAGVGYRRNVFVRGRHSFSLAGGVQHWQFPLVKCGTRDWLTHQSVTYRTRLRSLPVTVTSDAWNLWKSPLPKGNAVHSQMWVEHPITRKETVQVAFRHGPAHTYSWGFYGTHGNRVLRYQTMLAMYWRGTRFEAGLRKQWGLQPGIVNNTFWQFAVSRTFLK